RLASSDRAGLWRRLRPRLAQPAQCTHDSAMDWRTRITSSPDVCHGKACIRGTRITIAVILENLAAGRSIEQVLQSYPSLSRPDVQAAMSYAAELAKENIIPFTPGAA